MRLPHGSHVPAVFQPPGGWGLRRTAYGQVDRVGWPCGRFDRVLTLALRYGENHLSHKHYKDWKCYKDDDNFPAGTPLYNADGVACFHEFFCRPTGGDNSIGPAR